MARWEFRVFCPAAKAPSIIDANDLRRVPEAPFNTDTQQDNMFHSVFTLPPAHTVLLYSTAATPIFSNPSRCA